MRLHLCATLPRRDFSGDQIVIDLTIVRIVKIMIEFVQHFCARRRCEQ